MQQEEELVEQAREGSEEAFCELLRLHQAQVHAYIRRYVRNREIVNDLAQETFLKAYLNLTAYRGESSLRVWLLGIARNEALVYLRDEGRRRLRERRTLGSALEAWLRGRAETDSADPAEQARHLSALEDCIQGLPKHSAELVADVYFRGKSTGDVARQTGRQVGAVSMTLLRVRQALRVCIEGRLAATEAKP